MISGDADLLVVTMSVMDQRGVVMTGMIEEEPGDQLVVKVQVEDGGTEKNRDKIDGEEGKMEMMGAGTTEIVEMIETVVMTVMMEAGGVEVIVRRVHEAEVGGAEMMIGHETLIGEIAMVLVETLVEMMIMVHAVISAEMMIVEMVPDVTLGVMTVDLVVILMTVVLVVILETEMTVAQEEIWMIGVHVETSVEMIEVPEEIWIEMIVVLGEILVTGMTVVQEEIWMIGVLEEIWTEMTVVLEEILVAVTMLPEIVMRVPGGEVVTVTALVILLEMLRVVVTEAEMMGGDGLLSVLPQASLLVKKRDLLLHLLVMRTMMNGQQSNVNCNLARSIY